MRIVVTGKAGQVVTALLRRGGALGHDMVAIGRPDLDLADPGSVSHALRASAPDLIVSAAAYTAVDRAESDRDQAFLVNADGAAAVAQAAKTLGVPLIHLSTDYVFDGTSARPYRESDATAPTSVYGMSKLAGEQAILSAYGDNSVILRTAWVCSPFGSNFVKTMLRLAADRPEIAVVSDQIGNPTSAFDIADGILRVASNIAKDSSRNLRGVFHMTASGEASWADFAAAIFAESAALGGPSAAVRKIGTADYPTPAARPANSRLDCEFIADTHDVRLPDWHDSLREIIAAIQTSEQ